MGDSLGNSPGAAGMGLNIDAAKRRDDSAIPGHKGGCKAQLSTLGASLEGKINSSGEQIRTC